MGRAESLADAAVAWIRAAFLGACVCISGGCSRLAITQTNGMARVSLGENSAEQPEAPLAAMFARYAIFAALAYEVYDPGSLKVVGSRIEFGSMQADAMRAIAGWQVIEASEKPLLPCPATQPDCKPSEGLGFQIWRRGKAGCDEIVISFRGTDSGSRDDWSSNLRWLSSSENRYDQYDQVRTHIKAIIDRIERRHCGRGSLRIVATGHSLGGGLAQQAAYADPRIRRVYAFDPSVVTGYFDVYRAGTERTPILRMLEIFRVYEHGEILAYPRFAMRHIFPPQPCDPTIHSVRFSLITGHGVAQHSIATLTEQLLAKAKTPGGARTAQLPRLTAQERAALGCAQAARPTS